MNDKITQLDKVPSTTNNPENTSLQAELFDHLSCTWKNVVTGQGSAREYAEVVAAGSAVIAGALICKPVLASLTESTARISRTLGLASEFEAPASIARQTMPEFAAPVRECFSGGLYKGIQSEKPWNELALKLTEVKKINGNSVAFDQSWTRA